MRWKRCDSHAVYAIRGKSLSQKCLGVGGKLVELQCNE